MQNTHDTAPSSRLNVDETKLLDPVVFDCQGATRSYRLSPRRRDDLPIGDQTNIIHSENRPAFSDDRCLPVRGRAEGGQDGNFVVEEQPIDWTFRPADLQGVNDAFAVFVSGNSMVPKYKNGDLVYVHPTQTITKNRYALVETIEHKGFIKQFVSWQEDVLVVKQFNPEQDIIIPREQVLRLMLVIGSLDC